MNRKLVSIKNFCLKHWKIPALILLTGGFYLMAVAYSYKDYISPWIDANIEATGEPGILKDMFLLLAAGLFVLLALIVLMIVLKASLQRMWIPVGLALGCLYVFFIPLMAAPDEVMHVSTAYSYSNVLMGEDKVDEKGKVPARAEDTQKRYGYEIIPTRESFKKQYENFWNKELKEGEKTLRAPLNTNRLVYIPYTLGITIGRLVGMNAIQMYLLARFLGLLCYVTAVYFAIRLIPFGKQIMFIVASLPICIQQGSVITYDMTVNALCFLFIGYVLWLAYEKERIRWYDWILPCAAMAVIIPVKIVYIFLAGLVLFIPRKKCAGKYGLWIGGGCTFLAGFISSAIIKANGAAVILSRTANTVQWGDEPSYTIAYILEKPMRLVSIFFRSFRERGAEYLGSAIGTFLCRFYDIGVPFVVITGYIVVMALATVMVKKEKEGMKLGGRLWLGLLVLGIVGTSCLSMLLSYTSIYSPVMQGVQGRYFLPAWPLLLLALRNKNLTLEKDISYFLVWSMGILQVITLLYLFQTIISR